MGLVVQCRWRICAGRAAPTWSSCAATWRTLVIGGQAFGAANLEDYVRKAHAFVEHPPKGAETLTRTNGDTLFYDAKANVFAVADKSGAPRTMFKPDDGAAYWQEQKDRQAKSEARADRRSHRSEDDAA